MGKKLPVQCAKEFIGLLFLMFGLSISDLQAQISLTSTTSHEIVFTADQTRLQTHSARISLADMNLLSDAIRSEEGWNNYEELPGESARFYVSGSGGREVSVGTFSDESETPFITVSYNNESGRDFESLDIAFDFIYKSSVTRPGILYHLYSRTNHSDWNSVSGGEIQTSVLPSGTDEWNSFSIQLNLNEVYLRQNDRIDFRWMKYSTEQNEQFMPVALQRVEISPRPGTRDPVKKGSLIITELLPQYRFEEELIEYIEIYNPTDEPVLLRGLTVQSESGEIVIQREAVVQPYSFFVLANEGASRRDEIRPDYIYTGSIMPLQRGAVSIISMDEELAKATYQVAEQGIALELNEVKNSYDGYSSMEHLVPARDEIGFGARGSPGTDGATAKLFTKEIRQPGWHLFSPPGNLIEELNRNPSLRFSRLDNSPVEPGELAASEPFLMYKEGGDTIRIFTEESPGVQNQYAPVPVNNHSVIAGFTYPGSLKMGQILTQSDELAAPVIQVWNSTSQRFTLLFSEDDSFSGWEPVILNRSVPEALVIDTTGRAASGPQLNRYLQFRLFEDVSNSRFLLDDTALIGFLRTSGTDEKRYDLPKFLPFREDDSEPEPRSLIYLTSSENNQAATSFSHLPFELDKAYNTGLGHFVSGSAGNFTLDWSLLNDIPDEWILTLEDTQTGTVIDMREHTSYSFRSAGGNRLNLEDQDEVALKVFQADQRERFTVTMEPYRDIFSETGTAESSGDVELRQNYPNPFNPATTIAFYLPEERPVRLGIYNVVGQQVALLLDETVGSGEHAITWNASDMPSGIYIVQLEIGNRMLTRKITLIK